ncbi:unnamed protein product [Linum trigynum]|uniref:Uncharacterized protein n=1 Tax=Linum trigynum TaxID=586398 RepID=A0AAV2DVV6_9ROSI
MASSRQIPLPSNSPAPSTEPTAANRGSPPPTVNALLSSPAPSGSQAFAEGQATNAPAASSKSLYCRAPCLLF